MKILPLERQVCTPWQARKFLERLGDDAPESLWYWTKKHWRPEKMKLYPTWELILGKPKDETRIFYRAYSGDELGVILGRNRILTIPLYARDKADVAIKALRSGMIKKEDFRYE